LQAGEVQGGLARSELVEGEMPGNEPGVCKLLVDDAVFHGLKSVENCVYAVYVGSVAHCDSPIGLRCF
jgi:hypothetical protein